VPVWNGGISAIASLCARTPDSVCPPSDIASVAPGFLLSRNLCSRKPMAAVGTLRKWALRQLGEEFPNCRLEGQGDHSIAPTHRALKDHGARNGLSVRTPPSVREGTVSLNRDVG